MTKVDVLRVERGKRENLSDIVTDEIPLTIELDGEELITLLCSPDNLKELVMGFIYTAGLIRSIDGVRDITIDNRNWISHIRLRTKRVAPQRKRKIATSLKVSSEKIMESMNTFQKKSVTFRETGGVHSAGLSDGDNILVFKEDIGRHNALDKVIGEALIRGLGMKDLMVLTSGRISSEIVLKLERTRSPFLISRSAPTDQAVRLARELNLTLVGFARDKRMNVYTAVERVG